MMVGVQASLLLLLLVGCATPDWRGSGQQARDRQDIVAAHPEWPPEIRGAVAFGVISAGMTSDMVRAAWGRPARVSSSRSELHQHDTWHYTRRWHNADVIGGQTGGAQPLGEWTVAFAMAGWWDGPISNLLVSAAIDPDCAQVPILTPQSTLRQTFFPL
jgi:hypothetical protein